MHKLPVKQWDELEDRVPAHALVAGVDLVIIRAHDEVNVFYGRFTAAPSWQMAESKART
jgi:hypothetical protein